jgi:hypothetical protein
MIILPRKTIETKLFMLDYADSKFLFVHHESGFITKRRFHEWIRTIFKPYLDRKRAEMGCTGRAVVLLDGCRCYVIEEMKDELAEANIELLTIPVHTSHILQSLNFGIFGVFKLFLRTRRRQTAASETGNLQSLQTRLRAMEYLHQQDIVHRDLKTLTSLLDNHNNAHVGGSGLSARRRSAAALALRTTLRRRFFSANCTAQRSASIPTQSCSGRC